MPVRYPCSCQSGRAALLALMLACSDGVVEPGSDAPPLTFTTCRNQAAIAYRGIMSGGVWQADYARVLTDTLVVNGTLRIEEGVLVCGEAGAALNVAMGGELVVQGTPARPVVFTAIDPAEPWGGIGVADWGQQFQYFTGRIAHAVVEHALNGIAGGWTIENTVIRDVQGYGLRLWQGTILHSQIERATLAGADPSIDWYHTPAGLMLPDYGRAELSDVVVRGGGAAGIVTNGRTSLHLENVIIEGNAGSGLVMRSGPGYPAGLATAGTVRVTANGGYGATIGLNAAVALLAATDGGRALLGNAKDTLIVTASQPAGEAYVSSTIPWRITYTEWPGIAHMTIAPGATVAFEDGMVNTLVAEGTAEAPITLIGPGSMWLVDPTTSSSPPSRLRHVRIDDLDLAIYEGATIEELVLRDGQVAMHQGSTTMTRVRIENAPAVAITISAGHLQISDCEITGSGGHAIHAVPLEYENQPLGTPPQITRCNIHDNAGDGVRNERGYQVNARNNWWGDPDGPLGATGDGVYGDVDYADWATSPFSLGGSPAQLATVRPRR